MKKIIFFLFIINFSIQAQQKDTTDVYFLSLKSHIQTWKKFSINNPNFYKIPEIYFIEQDYYTTQNIPNNLDGQKIKILNRKEILKKTKKGETFSMISIRPAQWKNGHLEIHIIDFNVLRKNKRFFYTNFGGSSYKVISDLNYKISIEKIDKEENFKI